MQFRLVFLIVGKTRCPVGSACQNLNWEWEGAFAPSFETTIEQDKFIIQASQQLDGFILQVPPEQDTATGAFSPHRLDDADVDDLLLITSQTLESATRSDNALPGASSKDRFSSPVSMNKVQEVRKRGVPKKTAAQTGWVTRV